MEKEESSDNSEHTEKDLEKDVYIKKLNDTMFEKIPQTNKKQLTITIKLWYMLIKNLLSIIKETIEIYNIVKEFLSFYSNINFFIIERSEGNLNFL